MDYFYKKSVTQNGWFRQAIKMSIIFLGWAVSIFLGGCAVPVVKTPSPIRATTRPYVIKNRVYVPQKHFELVQTGFASYYGGRDGCHGGLTAMGERFNMFALTAAHKTLPLPSMILVENLENGKKLVVRVNDRGPYRGNRILDVSGAAARRLGFYRKGIARVRIRTLVSESLKLKENQKNFCKNRRKKSRLGPVPNLSAQRYYIVIKASTLGKAVMLKRTLSEWGKTDFHKISKGFHVLIGPYSTKAGACQVHCRLPKMYAARVLCFRRYPPLVSRSKSMKKQAPRSSAMRRKLAVRSLKKKTPKKLSRGAGPLWVNI